MDRRIWIAFVFTFSALVLLVTSFPPTAAAAGSIVVNNLKDTAGRCHPNSSGTCTLRGAINLANSMSGADTITFSVSGAIILTSPLPTITAPLTINAQGAKIQLDGDQTYTVLTNQSQGLVSLVGFLIANGHCNSSTGGGGGITNRGVLAVNQMTFFYNGSTDCLGGGAIENGGGTLSVTNSTFNSNTAPQGGGAIHNTGTLNISNSKFIKNQVDSFSGGLGGAISNELGGTANISGSTFTANSITGGDGGALANSSKSSMTVTDSFVINNTTDTNGAGITNKGGSLTLLNVNLTGNNNAANGGGMYVTGGNVVVRQSAFVSNEAEDGGAIYQTGGTLTVRSSVFQGNQGEFGGGAIYVYPTDTATLILVNSTLTQNTSKPVGNGGAIYNYGGSVHITNSTIWQNVAEAVVLHAGGIYTYTGSTTLRNTIVANNSGDECLTQSAALTADHFNLNDDGTCGNATQSTVAQINLGPLKNNGGTTNTLLPGAGSTALGAADPTICAAKIGAPNYGAGGKDQRSVSRTAGPTCDVGAVEVTQ